MTNLKNNAADAEQPDDGVVVYTEKPDSPFARWMKKAIPNVEVKGIDPVCDACREQLANDGLICRECGQSANENWFTYGVDHFGVCDECEVYWLMAVNMAGNALNDEMEERGRAEFVFCNYRELEPKPSAILTPRQVECYLGAV
jgi:hypothetical protein